MNYSLQKLTFNYKAVSIEILVPDEKVIKQYYEERAGMFPYWSKIWPAAFAITEFIIDHPAYVSSKKVLEIAAGLALPSMVAATYAEAVCYSDIAKEALHIVDLSAAQNELHNTTGVLLSWDALPDNINADVVLMSDVNYEPEQFETLYKTFMWLLDKQITILLSTPQRLMAKPFIESLLPFVISHEVKDIVTDNISTPVSVMVLRK